jgi:hypothetical protein
MPARQSTKFILQRLGFAKDYDEAGRRKLGLLAVEDPDLEPLWASLATD